MSKIKTTTVYSGVEKNNCRFIGNHSSSFYKEEFQKEMSDITNLICKYNSLYEGYSHHIFHRELAEAISYYYEQKNHK